MKRLKIFLTLVLIVPCAFAQKQIPLPKELPPYGPEKPLQSPSVNISKLGNGLTIWLISRPGFPKVSYTIEFLGGLAADPNDRPGISELLASTIDQGTKSRSALQIAQEIQGAGGDLYVSAGKDSISISTTILSSRSEGTLGLLADILQNASFPENEVALAKRNMIESLKQQEAEPSFLASRAMAHAIFGENPYHIISATPESIADSTPADLQRVYAQRFRPDQAVFIAVGDFQNEKILSLLKSKFGAWKAPSESPVAAPVPPSSSIPHAIFLVPRPGSIQTTIEIGTSGPLRSDPDYEAVEVINAMYGGMFGSRLMVNIREDKGYTYSPYTYLQSLRAAGALISHADVRNAVTAAAFNEMVYELNRLVTTEPAADEIEGAKRYLVGNKALSLQSPGSVAASLASLWIRNLPPEEIGVEGQKISALTTDNVIAAAKKYFVASHAVVVAVGDENVLREAFAPFGIPIKLAQ